MTRHGYLPGIRPRRVAVVHNDDFACQETAENTDEPPSLEANAEVALTARKIADVLDGGGTETLVLGVSDSLEELEETLREQRVDAVFNLVESLGNDPGREPEVPALLERLGIPYTGNSPTPLYLSHAKDLVKRVLAAHQIPAAAGVVIRDMQELPRLADQNVHYPLFIKPARTDASIGIDQGSIVRDRKNLRQRVAWLLEHGLAPVLVEEYLPGREINVAIFPNPSTGSAALTEVDFSAYPEGLAPIVTYDCKWREDSPEYLAFSRPCADRLDPGLQTQIIRVARAAFLALGGNSYGRVDIRLNGKGLPVVIDVNPNPDLDPGAGFSIAAASLGMDFATLIHLLADEAAVKETHVSSPYDTARPRGLGCFTAAY